MICSWLVVVALSMPAFAQDETPEWIGAQPAVPTAVDEPAAPMDSPPPARLEDIWASLSPDLVLEDAVARRSSGDFLGADERLAFLRQQADTPAVAYHQAISWELQERYDDAVAGYEAVQSTWPDSSLALDAAFRRALCLEDLGLHRESLLQVRALQRGGAWSDTDELSLELQRGVTELRSGRSRRGVRRIERALAAVEGTSDIPWMRAKARAALARYLLAEARELPFTGDRKAARNLTKRASLMGQAERQIIAVAQLGEAEYALDGLVLLGDAYVALHDDLLAARPPRKLSGEQIEVYNAALGAKAEVLQRKAWRYYDEGLSLAARTAWTGSVVQVLAARRDALGDPAGL